MLTDEQFKEKLLTLLTSKTAREVSQVCTDALNEQLQSLAKEYTSKVSSLLTTYEFEYRLSSFGVFLCVVSEGNIEGKSSITPDFVTLIGGEKAVKCISDTLNKAIQENKIC